MSYPRFNTTVLNEHAGSCSELYLLLKAGDTPFPEQIVTFGNLCGNLNDSIAHPEKFVPVGYKRVGDDFVPDTAPTDPLANFRLRQKVSQNCAWVLVTPAEAGPLLAVLGPVYHQYIAFYVVGGSGGLGVAENTSQILHLPSASGFLYVDGAGNWAPDVAQAADVYVAQLAAAQNPPRDVPPPVSV